MKNYSFLQRLLYLIPSVIIFLTLPVLLPLMTLFSLIFLLIIKFNSKNLIFIQHVKRLKILNLYGLENNEHLKFRLVKEIESLAEKEGGDEKIMACACVRQKNENYFGVIRIGSVSYNYLTCEEASTKTDTVEKLVRTLRKYENYFPGYFGELYKANPYCNPKVCPGKGMGFGTNPHHALF